MKSKIIQMSTFRNTEEKRPKSSNNEPNISMVTNKDAVFIGDSKITKKSTLTEVIDTVGKSLIPEEQEDNIIWNNNSMKFRGMGTLSGFESNLALTDLIACALKIPEFRKPITDDLTEVEIDNILDKFDEVSNTIYVGILETMSTKPDCYYCIDILDDHYKLLSIKAFNKSMQNNETINYYNLYDLWKLKDYKTIVKYLKEIQSGVDKVKSKIKASKFLIKNTMAINPSSISKNTIKSVSRLVDKMEAGNLTEKDFEVNEDEE